MPIIYRKTAKGLAEVETRVYRLAPRLRSVLIVIDGKRSDEELAQMLPQAPEALAALLQEDFISEIARTASPAPPPPPAYESTVILPKGPGAAFDAMRRDLLRAFIDRAGPAGETLAIKMERATSEAEFRALLPQAVKLVSTLQGRAAGEAFAARVDAW